LSGTLQEFEFESRTEKYKVLLRMGWEVEVDMEEHLLCPLGAIGLYETMWIFTQHDDTQKYWRNGSKRPSKVKAVVQRSKKAGCTNGTDRTLSLGVSNRSFIVSWYNIERISNRSIKWRTNV
jgi:hypothetical protein